MTALPNDPGETKDVPQSRARLSRRLSPQQPKSQPLLRKNAAAASNPGKTNQATKPRENLSRRPSPQQPRSVAHPNGTPAVASTVPQPDQTRADIQGSDVGLWDPVLDTVASSLDDIETVRIAQANRLRILTATEPDKDGITRGFGLDTRHPAVAALAGQLTAIEAIETATEKILKKQLRSHPLYPWIKGQRGLGDKQIARLLHAIGDPYWNTMHSRPRLVSELWAYCGLHVIHTGHIAPEAQGRSAGVDQTPASQPPIEAHLQHAGGQVFSGNPDHVPTDIQRGCVGVAAKRRRGEKTAWNTQARSRIWVVAESCIKQLVKPCARNEGDDFALHIPGCQCGGYRVLYDQARVKYADALHAVPCERCGPAGRPALTGSPLSAAHKKARAQRIVMKEILKDLWLEARAIHGRSQLARPDRSPPNEADSLGTSGEPV